jgi:hypothetical protein
MKYFRYATDRKELTLYPLVCWHVGSKRSDEDSSRRRSADSRRPRARWIYLGDGGECNIKASKGDLYSQTMNPGEQLNYLKGLFRPILKKGLFAVNGNHGRRIYKETGMDFDEELALRLQVPYMGLSCFSHSHRQPLALRCLRPSRTLERVASLDKGQRSEETKYARRR